MAQLPIAAMETSFGSTEVPWPVTPPEAYTERTRSRQPVPPSPAYPGMSIAVQIMTPAVLFLVRLRLVEPEHNAA
jgi:hypothetical protein